MTGLILIIVGTILIFWNENRAIKTYKAIGRAQDACVEMPDINTMSPDFEGKTVHAIGVASTNEQLTDDIFGVAANALAIKREVEYYQWVEHTKTTTKEKIGGATEETTTYTYEKEWVSSPQASAEFKDPNYRNRNFIYQRVDEKDIVAENVSFGAYKLPPFIVKSIRGDEAATVQMDEATKQQWNEAVRAQLGLTDAVETNYVTVKDNVVYLGPNMNNPEVGDVRITFTYVPNDQQISIIANVTGNTFAQYVDAKNGKTVSSVAMGSVSAEQMFESLKKSNKMWTWVIRLLLLILIIAGFRMLFRVVPTLLKVLPFLGKGVGTVLNLVCTVIGFAWTLVFMAIAWVSVRPVLAIAFIVVAIALIVWLVIRGKKRQSTAPNS